MRRYSIIATLLTLSAGALFGQEWRGIPIREEHRCSPYESSDYRHSPSVERRIVGRDGLRSPYEPGRVFGSMRETDIEHVVAKSEERRAKRMTAGCAQRMRIPASGLPTTWITWCWPIRT